MAKRSNPNGANQYQLDPRQKLCWDYYIDPESETFSSGLASALKAGYEQATAEHITLEPWFIEKLRTLNMLEKAEKNLNNFLELTEETDTKLRVKADVTKFVAERIGKSKYSAKSEVDVTSKGQKIEGFSYIKPDETSNNADKETGSSVGKT